MFYCGEWRGGRGNNWAVIPLDFIGQKFNEDNDAPVTFRTSEGGALEWSFNSSTGAGALTQEPPHMPCTGSREMT